MIPERRSKDFGVCYGKSSIWSLGKPLTANMRNNHHTSDHIFPPGVTFSGKEP